ncbi:MAG: indolepyruvate ferredoxin oxidoreductase family protein [Actinomycetia bacterium]|nr:indolepyruvate ferredoxin oxidoreductase family protein [Actinomycetes bacterium]
MTLADFRLEDRFVRDEGDVAMSGVQALLRVLLDQLRADRRDGINTAALVSGYRGSPLGGIDGLMLGNNEELEANQVTFIPGLNEDLGATAIWGSQLANRNFDGKYDGVLGMWYGKAPGLDRSGDAIRHANVCGVDPSGGVLLVAGDDPASKSSTLASESEFALVHLQTPIFYPGSVQEVADYGRIGYALSRYSGLWSALKIVTNVADGYSTIKVGPGRVQTERPDFKWDGQPWQHTQQDGLAGPAAVRMELEIHEGRMVAVERFVAHNKLNRQTVAPATAKVGLVAAGKTYYDLREALDRMGLDESTLERLGVRVFKPAVVWPLERNSIREFADGLEVVVAVEEKRAFLETSIRDILYGSVNAPVVIGKRDEEGNFWFPGHGEMDVDLIARKIRPFLVSRFGEDVVGPAVKENISIPVTLGAPRENRSANRMPNFCSGCPHNRSTRVPEGSEAGGGIGCHGMASMKPDSRVRGLTHMGGEGIQWIGAAPFVTLNHRFQNIGDGTFHHSGSLALRQAVAAGTNITYKILYNAAVAMTGGQDVDGAMGVPELTRSIEAEGVAKVMVVTDDPDKYAAGAKFAKGTEIWHRDRMDEAQRRLREIPGTTVIIYDQGCAAELRRDRKRGNIVEPPTRVFINEAVCEGCGDCGEKSSCLSVQPVETEFGRKTQIHQSSCNKDYSCLDGDCPAFVELIPGGKIPEKSTVSVATIGDDLPQPNRIDEGNILMMGIGGTGVVTVNQLLATAALLDGKQAHGLDQTGLSQKGGPVVSNLKIRAAVADDDGDELGEGNKVGTGEVDAYIVFDLLTGTNPQNLTKALPGRSVAVVSSSKVPTGAMVRDSSQEFPEWSRLQASIDDATTPEKNIYFDATNLSDNLFRSHMPANVIVLGAAYQTGVIPISSAAIERAIELNGVAVDMNVQAFRIGRKIAIDPGFLDGLGIDRLGKVEREAGSAKRSQQMIGLVESPSEELERLLGIRVRDLIDYQDEAYAQSYVDFVAEVRSVEAGLGDDTRLSEAVARYLHKLMAYKDEYEVARLHRSSGFHDAIKAQFGDETKITYKLHPPTARRVGVNKKIGFGRTGQAAFLGLSKMKKLRGTSKDPFGRTAHRELERQLIDEYREAVRGLVGSLSAGNYEAAVEVAELPDMVRGFEAIKERNVEAYRARLAELLS